MQGGTDNGQYSLDDCCCTGCIVVDRLRGSFRRWLDSPFASAGADCISVESYHEEPGKPPIVERSAEGLSPERRIPGWLPVAEGRINPRGAAINRAPLGGG